MNSAITADQDEFVGVSDNDACPGVLQDKLVAGEVLEFTELNDGSNEQLQIDVIGIPQFEFFSDETLSTTTSTDFISKLSVTTASKPAGDYMIHHQAELGQTDKQKEVGYEFVVDGTARADVRDGVSVDNEFQLRSGFWYVLSHPGGTIDIDINFGQTDGGGTSMIQAVRVFIFRTG